VIVPMPETISPCSRDQRAYTDELRPSHKLIRDTAGEWLLLGHAEVLAAALDHERFSSRVSRYLQIPNGLDGEEHQRYRKIIERYLRRESLLPFVPVFQKVAEQLVASLPRHATLDAVNDIGAIFAVRAQCAWLGWPTELEPQLLAWMRENQAANRGGNPTRTREVAEQFDDIIRSVILPRRTGGGQNTDDVTTRLCLERVDGRLLTEQELVSILRNWTGGDLGSIALCVGVLLCYLGGNPDLAQQLRSAPDTEVDAVIDEILRLDDPFVSNRRVTTCPVHIGGRDIPADATVKLHWTSANRDESVFGENRFDPQGHRGKNLVYGAGKHACPGRLLATWELRILLRALLSAVQTLALSNDQPPERESAPAGGYRQVPVVLT